MDYSTSIMMLIWFFYSTTRDCGESGYYFLLRIFYVWIDLLSTIFCIDSFINFMINSNFVIFSEEYMKNMKNIIKISVIIAFSYFYFKNNRELP